MATTLAQSDSESKQFAAAGGSDAAEKDKGADRSKNADAIANGGSDADADADAGADAAACKLVTSPAAAERSSDDDEYDDSGRLRRSSITSTGSDVSTISDLPRLASSASAPAACFNPSRASLSSSSDNERQSLLSSASTANDASSDSAALTKTVVTSPKGSVSTSRHDVFALRDRTAPAHAADGDSPPSLPRKPTMLRTTSSTHPASSSSASMPRPSSAPDGSRGGTGTRAASAAPSQQSSSMSRSRGGGGGDHKLLRSASTTISTPKKRSPNSNSRSKSKNRSPPSLTRRTSSRSAAVRNGGGVGGGAKQPATTPSNSSSRKNSRSSSISNLRSSSTSLKRPSNKKEKRNSGKMLRFSASAAGKMFGMKRVHSTPPRQFWKKDRGELHDAPARTQTSPPHTPDYSRSKAASSMLQATSPSSVVSPPITPISPAHAVYDFGTGVPTHSQTAASATGKKRLSGQQKQLLDTSTSKRGSLSSGSFPDSLRGQRSVSAYSATRARGGGGGAGRGVFGAERNVALFSTRSLPGPLSIKQSMSSPASIGRSPSPPLAASSSASPPANVIGVGPVPTYFSDDEADDGAEFSPTDAMKFVDIVMQHRTPTPIAPKSAKKSKSSKKKSSASSTPQTTSTRPKSQSNAMPSLFSASGRHRERLAPSHRRSLSDKDQYQGVISKNAAAAPPRLEPAQSVPHLNIPTTPTHRDDGGGGSGGGSRSVHVVGSMANAVVGKIRALSPPNLLHRMSARRQSHARNTSVDLSDCDMVSYSPPSSQPQTPRMFHSHSAEGGAAVSPRAGSHFSRSPIPSSKSSLRAPVTVSPVSTGSGGHSRSVSSDGPMLSRDDIVRKKASPSSNTSSADEKDFQAPSNRSPILSALSTGPPSLGRLRRFGKRKLSSDQRGAGHKRAASSHTEISRSYSTRSVTLAVGSDELEIDPAGMMHDISHLSQPGGHHNSSSSSGFTGGGAASFLLEFSRLVGRRRSSSGGRSLGLFRSTLRRRSRIGGVNASNSSLLGPLSPKRRKGSTPGTPTASSSASRHSRKNSAIANVSRKGSLKSSMSARDLHAMLAAPSSSPKNARGSRSGGGQRAARRKTSSRTSRRNSDSQATAGARSSSPVPDFDDDDDGLAASLMSFGIAVPQFVEPKTTPTAAPRAAPKHHKSKSATPLTGERKRSVAPPSLGIPGMGPPPRGKKKPQGEMFGFFEMLNQEFSEADFLEDNDELERKLPTSLLRSVPSLPEKDPKKAEDKRYQIAYDIVSSERAYCTALSNLNNVYIAPLTALASQNSAVLTPQAINKIFGNIPLLLGLTKQFLADMIDRIRDWTSFTKLGDIFLKYVHFFKMYSSYMNNYIVSEKEVELQLKNNASFREWVETCKKSNRCADLGVHLILPVRRIPKYHGALQQLIDATETRHPDYKRLENALDLIQKVAVSINNSIAERANRQKILAIQDDFLGRVSLVAPNRLFVRRGVLTKCGKSAQSASDGKNFTFFLFSDLFCYASKIGYSNYKMRRMIKIDPAFRVLELSIQANPYQNKFQVISKKENFVVSSKDSDHRDVWLKDIRACIQIIVKNRISVQADPSELSPIWHSEDNEREAKQPTKKANDKQKCALCPAVLDVFAQRISCTQCANVCCQKCAKVRIHNSNSFYVCKTCHTADGGTLSPRRYVKERSMSAAPDLYSPAPSDSDNASATSPKTDNASATSPKTDNASATSPKTDNASATSPKATSSQVAQGNRSTSDTLASVGVGVAVEVEVEMEAEAADARIPTVAEPPSPKHASAPPPENENESDEKSSE